MIKKIAVGLVIMALSTGVAYAAWTFLGEVKGNVFAVGTLKIEVTGTPIQVTGMPGDPPVTQTVTVKNTGNKAVQVKLSTTNASHTKGACSWVNLGVSATWPDLTTNSYSGSAVVWNGVNGWDIGYVIAGVGKELGVNASMTVTLTAQLDPNAPTEVQGDICNWDETFTSE